MPNAEEVFQAHAYGYALSLLNPGLLNNNIAFNSWKDVIEKVKSFMHYDLIISNNEYYGSKHKSKITSSYQLLDGLKEIEDFDIPVIVLTVSNDREKFLSYGFNEHIQKVLDEEKVMQVFPKVLKKLKFETIEKQ